MFGLDQHDSLDDHIESWIAAGIVTQDQGDAITSFEQTDRSEGAERLTVGAEVAAYLGSTMALSGGAIVVGRRWQELGLGARLAIAAGIALVGFLAGRWLVAQRERASTRLGGFMWVVGAGGVAMFVGVAMEETGPDDRGWVPLAVGLSVLTVGLALWRNRDRPLQLLTTAAGFAVTVAGVGDLLDLSSWSYGLIYMAAGALTVMAAVIGWVEPRLLAIVVGAVGAFGGSFGLSDLNRHVGPFVALVIGLVVVTGALVDRQMTLLAIGVIGTLVATQALLATTFSGATSSLVVSLLGLAVAAIAVGRTARSRAPD